MFFSTDALSNVVALYDFTGRSDQELSFKKGDILQVTEKMSTDWWYGMDSDGRQGFIPVNYAEIQESSRPSGDLTLQVIEALGILSQCFSSSIDACTHTYIHTYNHSREV